MESYKIEKSIGHKVQWEKYNTSSGIIDTLSGRLIGAGILPLCANTEYVEIEDSAGRVWLSTPEQVKAILSEDGY